MALTPDLVARAHRCGSPPGPALDRSQLVDAGHDALAQARLTSRPGGFGTGLLACGSLIRKPDVKPIATSQDIPEGWQRSFCFHIERVRGFPEALGLSMSLARGGRCRGLLRRLAPAKQDARAAKFACGGLTTKPLGHLSRWNTVVTPDGTVQALAFVMNRAACLHRGKLPPEGVADVLSRAGGHRGSGTEYLHIPVASLAQEDIRDLNLWRVQEFPAQRIRVRHA